MACGNYSLKGMGQECLGAVAGLKALYIGLGREWSVTTDADTHSVTALSALTSSATLYDYYIMEESSSLTSQLNINAQNGVKYYSNVINATFVRMRPEKHIELMALANEKLVIVAVDNNNTGWLIGADGLATATSETAQTGQAVDDLSGYQIELTARSAALPYAIAESLYSGKVHTPNAYDQAN